MSKALKKIFASLDLSKTEELDDGTIKVWGFASAETEDSDGETITADAMKAALPDYMKFGAVREMHQPKAAGTAIEAEVLEDGKTWFGAHVVDSEAVKKVKTGVYKGFSIGGKVTERDELNKAVIKGLKLIEVSLVDRPANPDAVFTMYKAETVEEISAVDALADLLNKGEVTPERLLELAKGGDLENDKVFLFGEQPSEMILPRSYVEQIRKAANINSDQTITINVSAFDSSSVAAALKKGGVLKNVTKGETIEKGMWSVQDFASVISTLGWICQDAQYEADYEGDNSPIPAQLRAWFATGIQIFKDMAAEETAELLAQLKAQAGDVDVIEMAARGIDLAKAGKRFSKSTKEALGAIHKAAQEACDHLNKLGYADAEEDEENDDADKAAKGDDLAKAAGEIKDAYDAISKAAQAAGMTDGDVPANFLSKLAVQRDTLTKRVVELEAMPAPGKALLKAIAKAADSGETVNDNATKVDPVTDHKGDVNEVATLIKSIHSGKAA